MKARAKHSRLQLEDHQLEMIAGLTEGDPAAAAQLLEKLALIADDESRISDLQLRSALFESSRDDIFSLREAIAAGDRIRGLSGPALPQGGRHRRAADLLGTGRRGTGAAHPWPAAAGPGCLPAPTWQGCRTRPGRINRNYLLAFLAAAAKADWSSKGLAGPDAWIRFERLAAALATLMKSNRLPGHLLR